MIALSSNDWIFEEIISI